MEVYAAKIATSTLTAVAGQVGAMLIEEAKMAANVKKDVQCIQLELESMGAFIRNAEERQDNEGVKSWVKEVKDIAYDTEDCIEDFALEVKQEQQPGSGGCLTCFQQPINYVSSRHRIGVEIKSLRARVEAASTRAHSYGFTNSTAASSGAKQVIEARNTALFVDETQLVGIEGPRDELIKLLADEGGTQLTIIPVVGMGGLGKSTLVRRVYESPQISGGQFQRAAWVTASQFPDAKGILAETYMQLFPDDNSAQGKTEQQLIRMLIDSLKEKRYIIVFDDLWKSEKWNSIRLALPDSKNGSRIMITTRNDAVATACCQHIHGHIYKLPRLSDEKSWELFCKKAFSKPDCPHPLRELSRDIVKKCGGLPRAIVTIGSILATKPNQGMEEWQEMYDRLHSPLETDTDLLRLNRILAFSYDDLPYYLKACFMYLSVFPQQSEIRRTRLVRRWMAEGFASGSRPEEVAESYFAKFVGRNIIHPKDNIAEKAKSCSVHDLVLELAISKAIEENFVTLLNQRNRSAINEKTMRHLSVQDSSNLRPPSLPHLRSLTMFKFNRQLLAQTEMRLLRVLDLEGCQELQNEDLTVVCRFLHLKYLSLRKTKVSKLPDDIGKLLSLQTLDIRNTDITTLPLGIVNLINLTYFLAGKSDRFKKHQGVMMPPGMGQMTALLVLSVADASGMLLDRATLSQLRKLAVTRITTGNSKQLADCLAMLSAQLHSLSLWNSDQRDQLSVVSSLTNPPRHLRTLELGGRLDRLPQWVSSLKNVSKITLCGCKLDQEEDLQVLQKLPSLLRLILIDDAFTGFFELSLNSGFDKLKVLHIRYLNHLNRVKVSETAAPDLEVLNVWSRTNVEITVSGKRQHTQIHKGGTQFCKDDRSDF